MKTFSDLLLEWSGAEEFFAMADLPAPLAEAARAYARRSLRARLPRQTLDGLPASSVRLLCRSHLVQAYQEFTAWLPLPAAA